MKNRRGDLVVESNGLKVFIDPGALGRKLSISLTPDFVESSMGEGLNFRIQMWLAKVVVAVEVAVVMVMITEGMRKRWLRQWRWRATMVVARRSVGCGSGVWMQPLRNEL